MQYRPFPQGAWRWSTKLGAFYPGFFNGKSRPGVNTGLRRLGASSGYQGDVAVVGGVYGWNDPFGVVSADRGWAAHEHQTGLFGYYLGLEWRHAGAVEVRAFRCDNRADPGAKQQVYVWLTRFNALDVHWAARCVLDADLAAVAWRYLIWGKAWDMDAWFVLGSYELRPWRWSARYERFNTKPFKGAGSPDYGDGPLTISALGQLPDGRQVGAE